MEKSVTAFFSYLVVVGVASWRTICPGAVRMFDPVGTEEKHGFDAATSEAFDTFQSCRRRLKTDPVSTPEF